MSTDEHAKTGQNKPIPLKDAVDWRKAPSFASWYSLMFIDFNQPRRFDQLLVGFLQRVKLVLQTVVILAFSWYPIAQVCLVLGFEILFSYHLLVSNIKVSLSLRIVDVAVEIFTLGFLVLKVATVPDDVSEDTRQKQLATAMVVCVYGIIVVSISFALFSLMLILFQLVIKVMPCRKSKVKPETAVPAEAFLAILGAITNRGDIQKRANVRPPNCWLQRWAT